MNNAPRRRALALAVAIAVSGAIGTSGAAVSASAVKSCPADNAGLSLPSGFCATVFADKLGHVRQMAFAPDGTLYVNTWSGPYYKDNTLPEGGFLVALKDSKGTGSADIVKRFGDTPGGGGHGGTGIAVYNNYVYAEINDRIVRYALKSGAIAPDGQGETVLSGMPTTLDHPMHPFIIRPDGALFVDMGSMTNACEIKNRMPHSKGHEPCTELETRAGTWKYDANKLDQKFSPSERYATGIRNGEGFDFDADGNLYVTQHGRDQLHEDWPELYSALQGYELPSEEVVMLKEGGDYGWPHCYFDASLGKLVLAPEYGGDGKSVGQCAGKIGPVASFPGHWAPNDMKIYKAKAFPEGYRGGMFIAFHGSWNRAPGPQGGYSVVFQPFAKGSATGKFVVFADGFAGPHKNPGEALHRPSGLAVSADGDLYVSDDVSGRIWRITYVGDPNAKGLNAAPEVAVKASPRESNVLPPEGIHPDAGDAAALPVPPGSSQELVALGKKVFNGEVGGATCAGCHSEGGVGSPVGADLTAGKWIWSDGSLDGLTNTIKSGVPQPKFHLGAMPPMGGVTLSDDQVKAVAAYVWALGHQK